MKTISPFGLRILLSTHLDGIPLFEIINSVEFQTEDGGNVKSHVIDNVMSVLKVAVERIEKDSCYIKKFKDSIEALLEYGGTDTSLRMKDFLNKSQESNYSHVLTKLNFSFPPALLDPSKQLKPGAVSELKSTLTVAINNLIQTE